MEKENIDYATLINQHIEQITKTLKRGNRVEIVPTKDGIKILETKRHNL